MAPRLFGFRTSAGLLTFLAIWALMLAIPRIHWLALFLASIGLTSRIAPWVTAHASRLAGLVRLTLPALAIVVMILFAWQKPAVSEGERRALESLPEAAPKAPNVLLIVLDTVRADAVLPHAEARDPTPFLTQLAARSVRFDEARSTAPWTLPSHASLFTGRWPSELSVKVGKPLDATHPTLSEHMAFHGYATAAFVANTHNGNAWYGLGRGFARYQDFYENTLITPLELLRSSQVGSSFLMSKLGQKVIKSVTNPPRYMYRKTAAMINHDALSWIDTHTRWPFFIFLNYYDAHDPYEPPDGAPRPFTRVSDHDHRTNLKKARDAYDDCLAYLDRQLEDLFANLERRGLLKNTVVVLTADHGEGFGEHELAGHAVSLYRQESQRPAPGSSSLGRHGRATRHGTCEPSRHSGDHRRPHRDGSRFPLPGTVSGPLLVSRRGIFPL